MQIIKTADGKMHEVTESVGISRDTLVARVDEARKILEEHERNLKTYDQLANEQETPTPAPEPAPAPTPTPEPTPVVTEVVAEQPQPAVEPPISIQ